MQINTISTKELRENFAKVKKAMREGRPLLLLYNSSPLAEIRPVEKAVQKPTKASSLKKIEKLSGGFKAKSKYSPGKLKQVFTTSYEE